MTIKNQALLSPALPLGYYPYHNEEGHQPGHHVALEYNVLAAYTKHPDRNEQKR